VIRMYQTRVAKKIFESKSEDIRNVGRLRLSWQEDVENIGFAILTAVTLNSTIFWDVTPCNLVEVNFCRFTRPHIPQEGDLRR
jgi:hypothetical protein